MKIALLSLAMLVSSGCVLSRTMVMPDQVPTLAAPEVEAHWQVGEVLARARLERQGDTRDVSPLEAQLEERLRRTLEAQAGLGYRVADAPYSLDVDLDVEETWTLSPWMGLGVGLETGVLLAGLGIGSTLGPLGMGLGVLVATPVALAVAYAPPVTVELGRVTAVLTLRGSKGETLARRHVRSSWNAELNGYRRAEKLAKASGASVTTLEHALLEELRDMLRAVPFPQPKADGPPAPQGA